MKSATATKSPNGHGSCYKEVRFSPTATPIMRRAQSLPNNHPYHHMNHTLGAQGDPSVSSANYLDQAQSLLDRQRANFEGERALFAEERQLWEQERTLLKSKIAELESLLRRTGATVADSTSPPGASAPHSSITFQTLPTNWSDATHSAANSQVWEGSSPGSRPTRVFPEAEKLVDSQTSLSEQGATLSTPSLDAALSPRSHATDLTPGSTTSVPIEKVDSKLDGITLKSTALPPEIFARVMTPPSPLSRETSPSATQKAENKPGFKLRLSELGPPERNLVRDAGHTPMAVIDRDMETELPSPNEDTKEEDEPLTPRALRQPAENSDSYFADLPDDPALKGPLSLVNDEEHDNDFLKELDQKLLGEARQVLGSSGATEESKEGETNASNPGEQEPELKLRSTTNFGTAFGDPELERYLAKQSFLA